MALGDWLSLLLACGFPLLAVTADRRRWLPAWSSSIITCYGIGILVSNLRLWPVDGELMESVAGGSMLVGLPLLLFAVRLRDSFRHAGSMLLSFGLCCIAGILCTCGTALYFADALPDGWQVAAMLTGLYTGGTPNVQAIGVALEAPADYLVLIQAADVLLGGTYLLGLVTFLPALYARIFPPTPFPPGADTGAADVPERSGAGRRTVQLLASLAVLGGSVLLCWLFTGRWLDPTVVILLLTTISLLLTLTPIVPPLGNTYPLGEYFVLIFCVALGLLADFRELASHGIELLYFSALALTGTTLLHLVLARLFRIDRDTVILSSVAAFYGPVFVVQVAGALRNRHLLAAGIAVSLLGFGIGNYLGIGVAFALRWLGGGAAAG
ncbi:DUF819 family protein [Lewinella sp. IMCC34183]|uniref:DUF819 family protein n=1 Tax=Lewinella sp. IMCC34183 TaxID=2248762 RepID=UPI000E2536AF|nr:DUF819 family protein [Lewinella sp. IMCC34183]